MFHWFSFYCVYLLFDIGDDSELIRYFFFYNFQEILQLTQYLRHLERRWCLITSNELLRRKYL